MQFTPRLLGLLLKLWLKFSIPASVAWIASVIESFCIRNNLRLLGFRQETAPPCAGWKQVSAAWLNSVLLDIGLIDESIVVSHTSTADLKGNRGLMGNLQHCEVKYADKESGKNIINAKQVHDPLWKDMTVLPSSLLLKSSRVGFVFRRREFIHTSYREAMIYKIPQAILKKPTSSDDWAHFEMPRAIYAEARPNFGDYVVLLEDLRQRAPPASAKIGNAHHVAIAVNTLLSNSEWGVPLQSRIDLPDIAYTAKGQLAVLDHVYNCAATMHGAHWRGVGGTFGGSKNHPDSSITAKWTLPHQIEQVFRVDQWNLHDHRSTWDLAITTTYSFWQALKKRNVGTPERKEDSLGPDGHEFIFDPKIVEILDRSFEYSTFDNFSDELHRRGATLIHGDFHAANMLAQVVVDKKDYSKLGKFEPWWKDMRVFLIDWSEAREWTPMADLGQLAIFDMHTDTFSNTPELIKRYHQNLCKAIAAAGHCSNAAEAASQYPFESCWDEFCKAPVERTIFILIFLVGLKMVPFKSAQFCQKQLLRFIETHGDHKQYLLVPPATFIW